MTPSLKGSWGHNPLLWEGYNWFYDSRFVDDGLTLAERAPWVVSNTITPCLNHHGAHTRGAMIRTVMTMTPRVKTSTKARASTAMTVVVRDGLSTQGRPFTSSREGVRNERG